MQVNQNNQTNYHNTYVTPSMSDMSPTQWEGEVQQGQPGHDVSFWSTGQPQSQSMGVSQSMGSPQGMGASQPMGSPHGMGAPQSTGSHQGMGASRSMGSSQSMGPAQSMGSPQPAGSPQAVGCSPSEDKNQTVSQGQNGLSQTASQSQLLDQLGRGGEARLARWRAALTSQPLDMTNGLSQEAIENPMSREEVLIGGLKGLLSRNLGHYVVATFIVGVQNFVVWRGVLESVGNDYLVIYQPNQDSHVSCDFYSLKFIEFPNSYDTIWNYAPGQEQK